MRQLLAPMAVTSPAPSRSSKHQRHHPQDPFFATRNGEPFFSRILRPQKRNPKPYSASTRTRERGGGENEQEIRDRQQTRQVSPKLGSLLPRRGETGTTARKKKRRAEDYKMSRSSTVYFEGPVSASRSVVDSGFCVRPLAMLALLEGSIQRLCCVALHCEFFEGNVPAVLLSIYQVSCRIAARIATLCVHIDSLYTWIDRLLF